MHLLRNSWLYVGAIVIGVGGLVGGILYLTNVLGHHPIRAYTSLGIGVILVLIGVVGMVVRRPQNPV